MKVRSKRRAADAPIRVYITEESCPACGTEHMGATAQHLNCYVCGFRRNLSPKETRMYLGLLLQQERSIRA